MSKKERGITWHRKRFFYFSSRAALVMIFSITLILANSPVAQSQDPEPDCPDCALHFDGKFNYAGVDAEQEFQAMTIQAWVNFGYDRKRNASADVVKMAFDSLPSGGATETSKLVASISQLQDQNNWAFRVCRTESDCTIITAPLRDPGPTGWRFLSATWQKVSDTQGHMYLYECDQLVADGPTHITSVPNVRYTRIGRGVAAILGDIAETAVWTIARTDSQIKNDCDCGIIPVTEEMFFYLPFDVDGAQVLYDRSDNGNDGTRGSSIEEERKIDPTWTTASISHDSTDTDGDGFPNACDNCPDDKNDQADRDDDGIGDVCDACPDPAYENSPNCGVTEGFGGSQGTVLNINTTITKVGDTELSWLPPDCDLTKITCYDTACLNGDDLPEVCALPRISRNFPVILARIPDTTNNYAPGGDFREVPDTGAIKENQCDLLYVYESDVLASVSAFECYACYENRAQDFDWNFATNECDLGPDECIDPANYRIWTGQSNCVLVFAGQFGIIEVHPTININNNGVTPVTIIGSPSLDVSDIRNNTIKLSVNGKDAAPEEICEPERKQISITDVNGDGIDDKILKFKTAACIRDVMHVNVNTECLTLEATVNGESFVGKDCTLNIIDN